MKVVVIKANNFKWGGVGYNPPEAETNIVLANYLNYVYILS